MRIARVGITGSFYSARLCQILAVCKPGKFQMKIIAAYSDQLLNKLAKNLRHEGFELNLSDVMYVRGYNIVPTVYPQALFDAKGGSMQRFLNRRFMEAAQRSDFVVDEDNNGNAVGKYDLEGKTLWVSYNAYAGAFHYFVQKNV